MIKHHVLHSPSKLMFTVYTKIFPQVNKELSYWQTRAAAIPDDELRTQALASITSKRFHCQGGSVFALLAEEKWESAVRFVVAYQTISDYLDNLCDRSTSMDSAGFRMLHTSMRDALTLTDYSTNYYSLIQYKDDNGYLQELVQTCREVIASLDNLAVFQDNLLWLEGLYEDLQVHKHVVPNKREIRLKRWSDIKNDYSLQWYEFSAATGSTLGIYSLVCYALAGRINDEMTGAITNGYFPYIQGLHILLDYYIDQHEDVTEKDLNFCSYYANQRIMLDRFEYFVNQALKQTTVLPDASFHKMVVKGLIGLYLGDEKVKELENGSMVKKRMLKASGGASLFFYLNTKLYYMYKKIRNSGLYQNR
ncbi:MULTISPECIES: tetraprenyl-beta-curcumene synthase family protein [Virgibacillus]|uniref:Tetraprenyl-beta-curcumene synthase n=1 Tax=Virgibacillus kapii TaxID=1638645 RepID=A0ABQ2DM39_9BACI|nr:tetraprenyl-beta-curcumene synthase family protein [Virgibacillus kapii]EQB37242.1 hypothetical protein M948_01535 [Virgibacillus sp. CM-4]GGJ62920.1 tetraprenyl-beta-curcumene synthase [Virgibacillus kapii]